MQIFLYEYTTGGGLFAEELEPGEAASLAAEGAAMIRALAEDFRTLGNVEIVALRDIRQARERRIEGQAYDVADAEHERRQFEQLARESAWTLVIAPELHGALAARCDWARRAGGRLLNCGPEAIALASDKHALAQHLAASGVAVPAGRRIGAGDPWPMDFELPAVIKPCDGAGSLGVRLIREVAQLADLPRPSCDQRIERYQPGLPASVGLLCGPAGNQALPACRQHLGGPSGFEYQGGSLPLAADLDARARTLACRAANCLPGLLGFVGVDLILGPAPDGSQDCVIEINPRLTTSYVGLRVAAQENLARAMLAAAEGRETCLAFAPGAVHFSRHGQIETVGQRQI